MKDDRLERIVRIHLEEGDYENLGRLAQLITFTGPVESFDLCLPESDGTDNLVHLLGLGLHRDSQAYRVMDFLADSDEPKSARVIDNALNLRDGIKVKNVIDEINDNGSSQFIEESTSRPSGSSRYSLTDEGEDLMSYLRSPS